MRSAAPLARLDRVVADAAAAARRDARPHWVALRAEVPPCDPLTHFGVAGQERFFWEQPAQDVAFAAAGATAVIEAEGPDRWNDAIRATRALTATLHVCSEGAPDALAPLLVGGFAGSDRATASALWRGFPASRWVLPACSWLSAGGTSWCTLSERVDPDAEPEALARTLRRRLAAASTSGTAACGAPAPRRDPRAAPPGFRARANGSPEHYVALVDAALRAIAEGNLEKVVLARTLRIECDRPFSDVVLLRALRSSYPSCTSFAVGRGDASFVGATPERLLRLEGRRLTTAALAGSAPRGHSPEQDAALARELRESKKEQAEHAVVVRELREILAPLCDRLDAPEAPALLRLEGIQHLETPFAGRLARARHLLELAALLHPTSAVAGAPRAGALAWLDAHEAVERGWYGGCVGFVTEAGDGELAVALRSALLRGRAAQLFAGAGIVAGSQPRAELQETRVKLRALLTPLLEV